MKKLFTLFSIHPFSFSLLIIFLIFGCQPKLDKTVSESYDQQLLKEPVVDKKSNIEDSKLHTTLDFEHILTSLFNAIEVTKKDVLLQAKWKPNATEKLKIPVSYDGFCYTEIDTVFNFLKNDLEYTLFVFATYERGHDGVEIINCHACAPMLSLATFKKDNNNDWTLLSFKKTFEYHGSWGEIGAIDLVQIGKNKYALALAGGGLAQGYMMSFISYYDIDTYNNVFEITTSEDNGGAEEDVTKTYGYEVDVEFVPSKEEYYQIETTTRGTILSADRQVIKADTQQIFSYDKRKKKYIKKQ